MLVREGRITDLHQIMQIHEEAREDGDTHGVDYVPDDFSDVLQSARHRCVVATQGHDILGFALAYDHATWGYIDMIAVRKRLRREGVGRALVEYLITNPNHWKTIELCHNPSDRRAGGLCDALKFSDDEYFVWRIRETNKDNRERQS